MTKYFFMVRVDGVFKPLMVEVSEYWGEPYHRGERILMDKGHKAEDIRGMWGRFEHCATWCDFYNGTITREQLRKKIL